MSLPERQLAVFMLLGLVLAVRIVAHREAGGMFRDQSDGYEAEGRLMGAIARAVFLLGGLGSVAAWLVAPQLLPLSLSLPSWTAWPALAATELGLVLLVWVQLALGVHFSGTLHLRDDHALVQSGPYARVRHPMYTAFLLILGGLSVLVGNLLVAAMLLGSQVWVLLLRLPIEEARLRQRFGPAWDEYRARTGALLPTPNTPRRHR